MKIFDVEYYFYRGLRQARFLFKKRFRLHPLRFTPPQRKLLIYGFVSFLILTILFTILIQRGTISSSGTKETPPLIEVSAPKEILPKVRKIPDGAAAPEVTAKAVYIAEEATGETLLAINEEDLLPPASITKVLTAVLALENFEIGEEVIVPAQCIGLAGSQIGLAAREVWTVKEMLNGMLVPSASDATCALASHVSQVTDYVAAMNLRAQTMGLKQTRFVNPIGLESPDHRSSAKDLVLLGRYAMQNPIIAEIVGTKSIEIHGRKMESTNELLGKTPGLIGIKTGFTDEAEECFLFAVNRDGRNIVGVVLGSKDRFGEAAQLIEWVYQTHVWN